MKDWINNLFRPKKKTYIGLLLAMEKQFIAEGKEISKKGVKHRRDRDRHEILAVRIATIRLCLRMAKEQL